LEVQGEFNTGEFINRFRRGSLVMQPADADSTPSTLGLGSSEAAASSTATTPSQPSSILYGSANGEGDISIDESSSPLTLTIVALAGAFGVIIPIAEDDYRLFLSLQRALNEVIHGVGGLDHKSWRSFRDLSRKSDAKNFIDGDLIESFLDLSKAQMEGVVESMQADGWAGGKAAAEGQHACFFGLFVLYCV